MLGLQKETHPVYETLAQVFYIGTGLFFLLLVSTYALNFFGDINLTLPFIGTIIDTTVSIRPQTFELLLTLTFGYGIAGLLMEAMQLRKKPEEDSFKDTQKEMDIR